MDKRQYFIEALQARKYREKAWIISVFAVTRSKPSPAIGKLAATSSMPTTGTHDYNLTTVSSDPEGVYFIDPNHNYTPVKIDGAVRNEPLLTLKERIHLQPGDLPNVTTPLDTTYGNTLINAIVLCWPFGGKIPFQTGQLKGSMLNALVVAKLTDNPTDLTEQDPDKIYVYEMLNYCDALSSLAGLAPLGVPAASPKSMTIDPAIIVRRNELLVEYKDKLHDPAIVARIESELTAMDKASFVGDEADGFYINKAKNYDVSRKRAFIMVGAETGFADSNRGINPVLTSLDEGWDLKKIPQMVDSLRSGSYNRGHETALGGESVKYFYRIFQNTVIAEPDCGTQAGLLRAVRADNWHRFVGLYAAGPDGELLTAENMQPRIGSNLLVRSPMLCKTIAPSFCARCMGEMLARNPTGLHIAAADIGSAFMLSYMKKMHGVALRTAKYDYRLSLT